MFVDKAKIFIKASIENNPYLEAEEFINDNIALQKKVICISDLCVVRSKS